MAALVCDDHPVEDGPQLCSGEPQQHLGGGQPLFHIKVVVMQGDTAMEIGWARKEVVREVTVQLFNGVDATCGVAQNFQWDGRVKLVFEQSLMRGGVLRHDEGLVSLLECRGGGG
jgi:hypothetical protein